MEGGVFRARAGIGGKKILYGRDHAPTPPFDSQNSKRKSKSDESIYVVQSNTMVTICADTERAVNHKKLPFLFPCATV